MNTPPSSCRSSTNKNSSGSNSKFSSLCFIDIPIFHFAKSEKQFSTNARKTKTAKRQQSSKECLFRNGDMNSCMSASSLTAASDRDRNNPHC